MSHKKTPTWSSRHGTAEMNPTRFQVRSLALFSGLWIQRYGSGVAVSRGVGCRCGSDPALLWLWRRLAATAQIRPLAWEPPNALGAAQEVAKRKQKQKQKKNKHEKVVGCSAFDELLEEFML